MNKMGVVLGVAVVVTLAGCKDPDYRRASGPAVQNEVKTVADVKPEVPAAPVVTTPAAPVVKSCTCPPGTRHTTPCACGASDCMCVVEVKPIAPVEPETTVYVVQPGDYLARISKRFNVTISSIKRLNGLKSDVIRVGQKLKLPGKVDVGAQPAAEKPVAKSAAKFNAYTGPTKEYVVKSGDTMGAIAYGNGINIRQLKELNSLTKDTLCVGQKIRIPADGKASKREVKSAKKVAAPAVAEKKPEVAAAAVAEAKPEVKAVDAQEPAAKADAVADAAVAEPAVAAPATVNYVVKDTDDIYSVSAAEGVTVSEIRELNNMSEDEQLVPGKTIKLPAEVQ